MTIELPVYWRGMDSPVGKLTITNKDMEDLLFAKLKEGYSSIMLDSVTINQDMTMGFNYATIM